MGEPIVSFHVSGLPAPQGSKTYVGHGRMIESSKRVKPWRSAVQVAARKAYKLEPIEDPAHVGVRFFFERPKSHYRTGKFSHLLKADAPPYPTSPQNGDLDKLLRSTFDALSATTGGCIVSDDRLIVSSGQVKLYASSSNPAGAKITVIRV